MAKIFLTGASGFIGGEVLHTIVKAHPEYTIAALDRDPKKGEKIKEAFPNVRLVHGTLEDASLIEEEASKADIVVHLAATGHLQSVQSILRGLTQGKRSKPAFWIQISGASLLSAPEIASKTFGEPSDKVYNDLERVDEITSLIKKYPNRAVDNFIIDVNDKAPGVHTALVPPAIIFGPGRGPVNQRSIQVPELARTTFERGKTPQVNRGLSRWDNVHIQDLSGIFLGLVEKAAAGDASQNLWNKNGLYFTGVGNLTWSDISQRVAEAARDGGYVKEAAVEVVTPEEADKLTHAGGVLWGTNARCEARRAAELLGWKSTQKSLEEEIPETVRTEAQRVGASSSHL